MSVKLTPLFRVNVNHSYFKDNLCTSIDFVITKETEQLIKDYGFIFRKGGSGFELYTTSASELKSQLEYIEKVSGQTAFHFQLLVNNPDFLRFTRLPEGANVQLDYSSNDTSNKKENGTVVLHQVLGEEGDTRSIGSVCIHFSDLIALENTDNGLSYRIDFVARSTRWEYFIINRNKISLNNPAIIGVSGLKFDDPTHVTLPNGQNALKFSSGGTLIPLSEVPQYHFNLVDRPSDSDDNQQADSKVIFKGLPEANPQSIYINQSTEEVIYVLPMYVYI